MLLRIRTALGSLVFVSDFWNKFETSRYLQLLGLLDAVVTDACIDLSKYGVATTRNNLGGFLVLLIRTVDGAKEIITRVIMVLENSTWGKPDSRYYFVTVMEKLRKLLGSMFF